jgi:hypothetical protein
MYTIEMHEPSPEFADCWQAAGTHLQPRLPDDDSGGWLRADLEPPFLEHLSFRIANQLFFIRVEDAENRIVVPGNMSGLFSVADGCKGHACLMPMRKAPDGAWTPDLPGWGLMDARTGELVDPISLITEEKIEMTDWELHDFAVQVVRDKLTNEGYELLSSQGNPWVDPSIWFVGDSSGPEWIVVRATRYPNREARRPANWDDIAKGCEATSGIGHFASVAFASSDDDFNPEETEVTPLWRGHAVFTNYRGLRS